ncbi:RNA-guided endonuclease TnpB family protein [Thermoanaerobacterium sp. RBIITD]|uniref:RNA-guided endonuclease InsQ/TnpB family protein n=1 Tax=Thermoanaerobacterium sp. RBIITD TaxID=1550240 RepID=UPI000BB974D3|nr:RNA-guided endonuclease TnpB family protein [Thermoanaerobacterium sp. RBIITD]SNX54112.1 transposase, IS605 OrfB family, central region [Thermoanaerobacterium sp. RBIITD]
MSAKTKSVFLYGKPTNIKLTEILTMQKLYTQLVNTYIDLLINNKNLYLTIFLNNKKDSEIRQFEKNQRNKCGLNYLGSALGQNAFDHALKELHNHFIRIKNYMYGLYVNKGDISNFISSTTLLNASLLKLNPYAELNRLIDVNQKIIDEKNGKCTKEYENKILFYKELLAMLYKHTSEEIQFMMSTVRTTFFEELAARKMPEIKDAPIQLDSRLCKIEKADHIKADYVIRVKTLKKGKWIDIPLKTSNDSARRLNQYKNGSPTIKVLKSGLIRVSVPVEKKTKEYKYDKIIGIDVGETELIHTSENKIYGSFKQMIEIYDLTVLPKLSNRSKLKALMRKYRKEIKKANDENKKQKLREKIGNINKMLQGRKSLNRVLRSYNHAVNKEISSAIKGFINDVKGKEILVSMEDLNILEFDRGRKSNRRDTNWARGQLLKKMQEKLEWHGVKFVGVEPAYTSQECPICHNANKKNRNGKQFKCICCGYEDDADHVGAINIAKRAEDKEIAEIVEKYKYNKKYRHNKLKMLLNERHNKYMDSVAITQIIAI